MTSCAFDGCDNTVKSFGVCTGHRRQQLKGEELRPLRQYQWQDRSLPCDFTGCERPRYARGLCKQHRKMQLRHPTLPLVPVGDRSRRQAFAKEFWESKTPEERAAHVDLMLSARGPITEEHARRISQALRNRHASEGPAWEATARECWSCRVTFMPNAPAHVFCTPECRSLDARVRKYGIDRDEFDRLMQEQGGKCALCGEGQRGFTSGKMLHFDHCHTTGKFRGLLCAHCNTSLGRFRDDPQRLRRAAEYLEAFNARQQ